MEEQNKKTEVTQEPIEQTQSTLIKIRQILKMLKGGSTITDACEQVSLSRPAFYRWSNNSEENKQRLYDILDKRTVCVEDALFKNALDGDTKAQTFFLKNRATKRWSDRHNIELTGDKDKPLEVNMTEKPTNEIINEVIAKLTEQ